MPLILGANSVSGGYEVANSLRFVTGDSLTRTVTPSSSTSYTVSFWLKLSDLTYSSTPYLWSVGSSAGGNGIYLYDSDRKIYFFDRPSGFLSLYDGVLRDPSAWYHVVWSVNSGTGTGYINGITGNTHSSIPALNDNTGDKISIHDYVDATLGLTFVGCYMSEFNFIDGQALTPSSFGQTDPSVPSSGIWIPKAYTGSFGTNGFYLKFANSAALGTDSSGNGNTFTVNNLTSVDQSTDTCTNNFATMNPLNSTNSCLLTEGNLIQAQSSNDQVSNGTIGFNKSKWYWEFKMVNGLGEGGIVLNTNKTFYSGRATASLTTNDTCIGRIFNATGSTNNMRIMGSLGSSTVGASVTYSSGDIVSVAVDADAGKIWFAKNGTYEGSGNPATGSSPTYDWSSNLSSVDFITAIYGIFSGASPSAEWNFGSPPFTISSGNADANGYGNFEYAVPSGYFALCTKNLAEYA